MTWHVLTHLSVAVNSTLTVASHAGTGLCLHSLQGKLYSTAPCTCPSPQSQ